MYIFFKNPISIPSLHLWFINSIFEWFFQEIKHSISMCFYQQYCEHSFIDRKKVEQGFTLFRYFLPIQKMKFQFSLFNWNKCLCNWSQSVEHNRNIWFNRLSEIKWTSPSNDTQHHPPVSVKVLITWVLAWYCMKPNILWFVPVGGSNGCILVTLVSCHHLNIVNTQH